MDRIKFIEKDFRLSLMVEKIKRTTLCLIVIYLLSKVKIIYALCAVVHFVQWSCHHLSSSEKSSLLDDIVCA